MKAVSSKKKKLTNLDKIVRVLMRRKHGIPAKVLAEKAGVNYHSTRRILGNNSYGYLFDSYKWYDTKGLVVYRIDSVTKEYIKRYGLYGMQPNSTSYLEPLAA